MEETKDIPGKVLFQLWVTVILEVDKGVYQELNTITGVTGEDNPVLKDSTSLIVYYCANFSRKEIATLRGYTVTVVEQPNNPKPVIKNKWLDESHNLFIEVTTDGEKITETNLVLIPADLTRNRKNYITHPFYHFEVVDAESGDKFSYGFWRRHALWVARDAYRRYRATDPDKPRSICIYEVNMFGQRTCFYEYHYADDHDSFDYVVKDYLFKIPKGSKLRTLEWYQYWQLRKNHQNLFYLMQFVALPAFFLYVAVIVIEQIKKVGLAGLWLQTMDHSLPQKIAEIMPYKMKYFLFWSAWFWMWLALLIKNHQQ